MNSPHIHLYVHGRGRGHGTRARAIFNRLRAEGATVDVFVGTGAKLSFQDIEDCHEVQSLLPSMGFSILSCLTKRVYAGIRASRSRLPDLIISDGDLPGLLVAHGKRIPSIAVGHGLVFSHAVRPSSVPRAPWRREALKAFISSYGANRHVAVNFLPLKSRSHSTVVARPILRESLNGGLDEQRERDIDVLCYFRDDNGDAVLQYLVSAGQKPLLFSERDPKIPGVTVASPDSASFHQALCRTRAVVSSAGSQLISECVALGIPQFSLYSTSDDEQCLNVEMLRTSGLGDGAAFGDVDSTRIVAFIKSLSARSGGNFNWGKNAADAVWDAAQELLG